MIKPADRISTVQEYYFSVKLKEIDKLRQEGQDIINLGIGSPDQPPAEQVIETLGQNAKCSDKHGYQSYIGIPSLRKGFASWYKRSYGVDVNFESEVIPMMGSKEAIMHISMAFLNPGDEVLLPNPGYPTYTAVTNLVGAVGRYYDLTEENHWQPDLEYLEKQDLSKVKIMWVNYPNMPTGAPANPRVMKQLIDFGRKYNILICNDNPYSFVLNPKPSSLLSIDGAKDVAIELNSLSKSHNMAGWRIGMVASNETFIKHILRVKSNMDSGMFRPMQEAAAKALELDEQWYARVNSVYALRRALVYDIMDALECTYDRNQVGLFIWAKIPDKYKNAQQVSDLILYKAQVFITPGFIFGSNGARYIRISLCASEELLKESVKRIKQLEIQ